MKTFEAEMKQYLRPTGAIKIFTLSLPEEFEHAYKDMRKAGYTFAAEALSAGMVSTTIENHERDADSVIVSHGSESLEDLTKMLERRRWEIEDDEH